MVSTIKSFIRLRHYRSALALINNTLRDIEVTPDIALLWARAAGGARDWPEVDRAVDALRRAGSLEGRGQQEFEMWTKAARAGHALSKLTPVKGDFRSRPAPPWVLAADVEWLEREGAVSIAPAPPETVSGPPIRYLSRPCPSPVNGERGFYLGVDLCIEKLPWNRIVEIGLARIIPGAAAVRNEFYGFRVSQGGNVGSGWRWVDLAWKDAPDGSPDLRFDLREGGCYRIEVEHSPVERRVRLLVREIEGPVGSPVREFHRAWPPDAVGSWEKTALQKAEPIAPGNYELGVFTGVQEGPGEGKDPLRVRLDSIELRVAALP